AGDVGGAVVVVVVVVVVVSWASASVAAAISTPEPAPIVATQLTAPSTTSRSTRFIRALDRPDAPQRRIFKTPSRLERQGRGAVQRIPGRRREMSFQVAK